MEQVLLDVAEHLQVCHMVGHMVQTEAVVEYIMAETSPSPNLLAPSPTPVHCNAPGSEEEETLPLPIPPCCAFPINDVDINLRPNPTAPPTFVICPATSSQSFSHRCR